MNPPQEQKKNSFPQDLIFFLPRLDRSFLFQQTHLLSATSELVSKCELQVGI